MSMWNFSDLNGVINSTIFIVPGTCTELENVLVHQEKSSFTVTKIQFFFFSG